MRSNKNRKKVKGLFFLTAAGVLLSFSLATWAGVSTVNYLVFAIGPHVNSLLSETNSFLKDNNKVMSQLQPMSCFEQFQSLLNVQSWLEKSLSAQLEELKFACYRPAANSCADEACLWDKLTEVPGKTI